MKKFPLWNMKSPKPNRKTRFISYGKRGEGCAPPGATPHQGSRQGFIGNGNAIGITPVGFDTTVQLHECCSTIEIDGVFGVN